MTSALEKTSVLCMLAAVLATSGSTIISRTYDGSGLQDKAFTENVVVASPVQSVLHCALLCNQEESCETFTYEQNLCRGHAFEARPDTPSQPAPGARSFSTSKTNLGAYRPKDCVEARLANNESGVVTVYPEDNTALQVYCDQDTDGGGWLVFQRRQNGSVEFYRGWTEYQNGFGEPSAEFWLGLDALHTLTSKQSSALRVDLMMWNGTTGHATYSNFSIGDSSDNYRMHFGTFTGGNAGDSMIDGKNYPFSTHDADHDDTPAKHCAEYHHGAWWYKSCHDGQLNSRYKDGRIRGWDGVVWSGFDENFSLKFSEMKIRPL